MYLSSIYHIYDQTWSPIASAGSPFLKRTSPFRHTADVEKSWGNAERNLERKNVGFSHRTSIFILFLYYFYTILKLSNIQKASECWIGNRKYVFFFWKAMENVVLSSNHWKSLDLNLLKSRNENRRIAHHDPGQQLWPMQPCMRVHVCFYL